MKLGKAKVLPLLFIISWWLFLFPINITSIKASPGWLGGWDYRQSHVIENATGAGTNYQVYFNVYRGEGTSSGNSVYLNNHNASTFPSDLRFTDDDEVTLLDYWIEDYNSIWAGVWVEVADDLSTVDQTVYVYYGKSGQSSTSSGNNTFSLFDDFPGSSLNTSMWNSAGSPSIADSRVTLTGTEEERIYSINTFGLGTAVRGYGKLDTQNPWSGYNEIGYDDGTPLSHTNAVFLYSYGSVGALTGRSIASSNQTNVAMDESESSAWRKWDVMRPSSSKCQFRVADGNIKETTTNIPSGSYFIQLWARRTIDITEFDWILVRNYVSPEPTHGSWGSENACMCDVAMLSVTLSKTIVSQGYTTRINVTSQNQGECEETFDVILYANTTQINQTEITLASGASTTITFTWNTTGYARGNYTVGAHATPLPGETDTYDNTYIDGTVLVTIAGDANGDYIVDIFDLTLAGQAFASYAGEPRYSSEVDITDDGHVDMRDIVVICRSYGKTNQ